MGRQDIGKKRAWALVSWLFFLSHLASLLRRLFVSHVVSLFVIFVRYTNIATTFAFYFASNDSRRAVFILSLLDMGTRRGGWVFHAGIQDLIVSYLSSCKRVVIATQRTRNES